jgi:hydrogenase maturation protein HypF
MQRHQIEVRGIVQGVGFRPHVYALANRLGLSGFVQNRRGCVCIEVEGEPAALDRFVSELRTHPPETARVDSIRCLARPLVGEDSFFIRGSETVRAGQASVAPDVAVCKACVKELFDPGNRRFRYPFISCTQCGPRLTIITAAPYDRARTTLRSFPLCSLCRAEYDDPLDRRFHAQTIACVSCGPRLTLLDRDGAALKTDDPINTFAAALKQDRIGAIKGLGGYHLCCDAANPASVELLRLRKGREEKAFALMVADLAAVEQLCCIKAEERTALCSSQAPIVLLQKKASARLAIADAIAPGNPELGVMLPYTPLHHLLLQAVSPAALVMTSGNRSDEPLAYRDEDALQRLEGIADLLLTHDRPIHVRCDDSVLRIVDRQISPIRRARGFAPAPIPLPFSCPRPILAMGGQLKATFALGTGSEAFVSHHLGDLDHLDAYRAFEQDLALYRELLGIEPQVVAHDLHPDYASSRFATACKPPTVAVQHHHAHLASCLAEHGLKEPAIGVILDGAGLGTDGAIWGGEFLVGGYRGFRRAAHLRYVRMPGGETAAREPWRMAVAHLLDAGCGLEALSMRVPTATLRTVARMIERNINAPRTSSMGRLFDAVAALCGIRMRSSYEGQAAMELQWRAMQSCDTEVYPWDLSKNGGGCLILDTRPMIREIATDVAGGTSAPEIARRFHLTVVQWIVQICDHIRKDSGLDRVALSGGVFMNTWLSTEVVSQLSQRGFTIFTHREVPANDGGLSLGQLAVAAHSLA